jgi:predicted transposase/invertase (TIGR01784 family)
VEEFLIRRFKQLSREEIRNMFELADLRKTKVWQEARDEGLEEGQQKGREQGETLMLQKIIRTMRSKGKSVKDIAEELDIPVAEVRRLAKNPGK